jgi:hypothetical protein
MTLMSEFVRDLRFGVRLLAKSPVFTATAALLLAVGISANTLIFSVVNALLLRPLPVSHPENLVRLIEVHPTGFIQWEFPYKRCDAVTSRAVSLSEVICQGETDVAFSDSASTERVRVHLVSPNFFSSLGVHAALGRVLTAEDERTAAMNAVLSYGFWQRRFQRDASALGRSIVLRGHPFAIVAVTPEAFNGLAVDTSPDVRVPGAVNRSLVEPRSERTREIGLRMALGAPPARIVSLLSRETLLLVASGAALGLCAYAAAAVWMRRILYDVRSWEPLAVGSVLLLVGLVAAIAAAPAVYRAVRIDPASALRAE